MLSAKYRKTKKQSITFGVIATLILFMGIHHQTAYAQDRITVVPDNFPLEVGSLNLAIEENGGDVIYVLQNGATYWTDQTLDYDHDLHFEAEEFPSDNPPIIRVAVDELGEGRDLSGYLGDVTAKGIFFYGKSDLGTKGHSQRNYGEGAYLHYQYCYFMDGNNYFFRNEAANTSFRIEDSRFGNFGRHTSVTNQRLFSTRGNEVDSIIVVNNTLYQVGNRIYDERGGFVDYFHFEHNTVVNHGTSGTRTQGPFDMGVFNTLIVKNNLFRNINVVGAWESAEVAGEDGHYYEGPRYYEDKSWFEIDAFPEGMDASDSERTIIITHNNFGGFPDEEYIQLWSEFSDPNRTPEGRGDAPWGTDPDWLANNPDVSDEDPEWANRDTIPLIRVKAPVANVVLQEWIDSGEPWVTFENNLDYRVELEDMPDDMVEYAEVVWYGGTKPHHYDRWDAISDDEDNRFFNPTAGTPNNPDENTAAWFRYMPIIDQNTPSFTHAENGYPLGNLNYYPELRERWEAGEVITSIEQVDERPADFRLVGNYPNPFNPTTNIVFELADASDVTLQVYNVLGQRVATMELGAMSTGQHEATFDGSSLTSGVYMVRMQAGSHVRTMQMTLVK